MLRIHQADRIGPSTMPSLRPAHVVCLVLAVVLLHGGMVLGGAFRSPRVPELLPAGTYEVSVAELGTVRMRVFPDGGIEALELPHGHQVRWGFDAEVRAVDQFELHGPRGVHQIALELAEDGTYTWQHELVSPPLAG